MQIFADSVDEYIGNLPEDRQETIRILVNTVRKHLPEGYEESMEWGMPTWQVPLSAYPDTYNKRPLMYAAVASQKNHYAVYVMSAYGGTGAEREKIEAGFKSAGKKLDMGGSCIRFKKLEDVPLDVIAEAIAAVPMEEHIRRAKTVQSAKHKK